MIEKENYETRFNSYLKHISGDGQTIKNLLDVFYEMLDRINTFRENYDLYCQREKQMYEEWKEKIEKEKQNDIDNRFILKVGQLKTATYRALKKFLDEEFKGVIDD